MARKAPSTAWKPGQSGNPKGRPPKERALTTLLEKAGSRRVEVDGRKLAARKVMVAHIWQGLTSGVIDFGGGNVMTLDAQEYIGLAKLVFGQVDGPPKAEMDVTSGGEPLQSASVDSMKDLFQMMGQREKYDAADNPAEV